MNLLPPPGEHNPFQAPAARIGGRDWSIGPVDPGEAERVRRDHIAHETSIKILGILFYLGAAVGVAATIGLLALASGIVPMEQSGPDTFPPELLRVGFLGTAVVCLALAALYVALGLGLRRLQIWARWTLVVLTVLDLLYTLAVGGVAAIGSPVAGLIVAAGGSLIPAYVLYLMVAPAGGMVFSAEYREVIRMTPRVRARTSLAVKLALALLAATIVFGVVAALMPGDR